MPFLKIPQHLGLFSLRSAEVMEVVVLVVVELVAVAVVVPAVVVLVGVVLELVEASVEGSGTLGLGQVISLAYSGQNSLIFWKRYHW